ncbi:MAG TPA: sulfotransferase [Sphingomonadaceae bacterium]|nr:sulfotransferase [Sphingomonadaceae bacterium]
MVDSPVFLVGAERSGTTLLRLMLDGHPDIAFMSESEFLVDAIDGNGRFPEPAAFEAHLAGDRVFRRSGLTLTPGLDFRAQADDFLEQRRARKGAGLVGATVHRDFDRLLLIWPNARFIHLVRDGRDVGLSTIPMGWSGNIYSGIRRWVDVETIWDRLEDELPADRHITVRYEALAHDAEAELRTICAFLGEDFREGMLAIDQRSTYSAPHSKSIGKHRRADPVDVGAAESIAGRWLTKYGYALSGARPPGRCDLVRLSLQNRWAIANFRRRRYSTPLWLASVLAKRVGTPGWRAAVRRRLHAVDDRHLK